MELGALLIRLVAVLLCAKLAGEAAERLGQTAVLGELLAGVVLGPSALGLVHESEILRFLAEIGVILLLFEIVFSPSQSGGLRLLLMTAILTVAAVIGKLVSGLAIYQRGARRLVVGVGMVPRGEVGLIFAGLGLSLGLGGPDLYASLVTVVMLSTFIVPVWLRALYRAKPV